MGTVWMGTHREGKLEHLEGGVEWRRPQMVLLQRPTKPLSEYTLMNAGREPESPNINMTTSLFFLPPRDPGFRGRSNYSVQGRGILYLGNEAWSHRQVSP